MFLFRDPYYITRRGALMERGRHTKMVKIFIARKDLCYESVFCLLFLPLYEFNFHIFKLFPYDLGDSFNLVEYLSIADGHPLPNIPNFYLLLI